MREPQARSRADHSGADGSDAAVPVGAPRCAAIGKAGRPGALPSVDAGAAGDPQSAVPPTLARADEQSVICRRPTLGRAVRRCRPRRMSGGPVPAPPGAERLAHDQPLVLLAEPRQLIGEHCRALAPGAGHLRDVGAPEHPMRSAPMPTVRLAEGLSLHCAVDDYLWSWQAPTPVLMMHGFARNATFWNRWVPAIAESRRVYRPDLLGCGASDVPAPGYRYTPEKIEAQILAVF